MLDEEGDVRLALRAQGWQVDGDDVDAVIEIAAHGPLVDALEQVAVGRRDDAHVGAVLLRAAYRGEAAVLNGAQQLELPHEADFSQFVKKERTAVRLIEIAFFVRVCAREGPFFVPEQLAFKEAFRNGPAVDGHKGLLVAGAPVVYGAGHQFLARARFAVDDHVVVHGGGPGDENRRRR